MALRDHLIVLTMVPKQESPFSSGREGRRELAPKDWERFVAAAQTSNIPTDFFSAATLVFSSVISDQNFNTSTPSFWQEVGSRLWGRNDFTVDQTRYLFAYGCAIWMRNSVS